MSEAIGSGPPSELPKNSYEQPVLHEEFGPDLDGVQYWTRDTQEVLDGAMERVRTIRSTGAALPRWANTLSMQYDSMLQDGRSFQRQLIADSEAIDYGRTLERRPTGLGSIKDWYRRLGPTNEAEDMTPVLLGAVKTLESSPETAGRDLLIGNLLEDAALRSSDPHGRTVLLTEARHSFLAAEQSGGIGEQDSRAAFRQRIDCEYLLLAERYKVGKISEDEYYERYEGLQKQSLQKLAFVLDKKNGISIGDGELLEWASLVVARHHYWSEQTAERYTVRSALIREDQAIYPWKAENASHPIWSFDTVVSDQMTDTVKRRIQLKNGKFQEKSDRDRLYLPSVVTVLRSEKDSSELRDLLSRAAGAFVGTYETMRMDDLELAKRFKIDQEAIDTLDTLFAKVLA